MFFKKPQPKPEPAPEPKLVKCDTCKHLIEPEDAQMVIRFYKGFPIEKNIYCPEHKKPYDKIYWNEVSRRYAHRKLIPAVEAHYVEVNEDGTPINIKK